MRIHLLGVALTFVGAVLFLLLLKGMLSPKPPFVVAPPAAVAPDSSAAEGGEPPSAGEPPAEEHGSEGGAGLDSERTEVGSGSDWTPVEAIDTGLRNYPYGSDEPAIEADAARESAVLGAESPAEDTAPAPAAEGPQLARLVRVYEKMRPKQVAQVFDSLPDEQTVAMLSKMNERAAAKVIAAMDPANAARLSQMLVETGMP